MFKGQPRSRSPMAHTASRAVTKREAKRLCVLAIAHLSLFAGVGLVAAEDLKVRVTANTSTLMPYQFEG